MRVSLRVNIDLVYFNEFFVNNHPENTIKLISKSKFEYNFSSTLYITFAIIL